MRTRIRQITFKSVSFVVVACLLLQPCVTGLSEASVIVPFQHQVLNPTNIQVNPNVAKIENAFEAANHQLHIHLIKDAHTNASCQINTADLLNQITQERPVQTIYLEAGEGNVSLSFLRRASLQKRKDVGLQFIHKGLMQGAEYFNLTSDSSTILFGVEDQNLYQESVGLYDEMLRVRSQAQRYLSQLELSVRALKERVYSSELKKYDQVVADYEKGIFGWTDYFDHLIGLLSKRGVYKTFDASVVDYKKIREMERNIDFSKANQQVEASIEALNEEQQNKWKLNTDHNIKSINRIVTPENHGIDRYLFLERLLLENPQTSRMIRGDLKKYFEYIHSVAKLDLEKQIQSVKEMEAHLYSNLITSAEEARVHEVDQKIQALNKLIQLQADPELMGTYLNSKELFTASYLSALINRIALDQSIVAELAVPIDGVFERAVETAEAFYRMTELRDKYFVNKMLERMETHSESESVLVIGGYHGPNLEKLFREKNISYTVWMPAVTHETDQARYEKILTAQNLQTKSESVLARVETQTKSAVMVHQLAMDLKNSDFSGEIFNLGQALGFTQEQMILAASRLSDEVSFSESSSIAETVNAIQDPVQTQTAAKLSAGRLARESIQNASVKRLLEELKNTNNWKAILEITGELDPREKTDGLVRKIETIRKYTRTGNYVQEAKDFISLYFATIRSDGTPEGRIPKLYFPVYRAFKRWFDFLRIFPYQRVQAGIQRVKQLLESGEGAEGNAPVVSLNELAAIQEFKKRTGIDFDVVASQEYLGKKSDGLIEPTLSG